MKSSKFTGRIEEIGQFSAGFFHISKRRKTSLKLNRKENYLPRVVYIYFVLKHALLKII